jgi:hypothetical protein
MEFAETVGSIHLAQTRWIIAARLGHDHELGVKLIYELRD